MLKVKGKEVELKVDWFTVAKLDKDHGITFSKLSMIEDSPVIQTQILMACMPKDIQLSFDEACEVFNENGPVKVIAELGSALNKYFGEDMQGETKA